MRFFFAFPVHPSPRNFQLRIFCDPKGILGFWESQRGAGRAQIQNHCWILWFYPLHSRECWNHDEDLCNTPLSTASPSIIYLPLPRLLHPWEFWGFALGFVRVKPGSSTHLPPRFGWGRQGGTAALLIYITTHFTGRKMLFLSLGATRKESKELEAERSKFLLLRLFCPLFRPTAFLKHKRETEEIRAVSSKSLPVKSNCEESTQDKRVRN